MAIQISGTSVITDGRGLVNVTAIDTSTKNAIVAAGVGGAVDLSGGVGSAGVDLVQNDGTQVPIGGVVLLDTGSSYINYLGGQRYVSTAKYGMSVSPNTSGYYFLFTIVGDGTSTTPQVRYIGAGTWRILSSSDTNGKTTLAQRIA